MKRQLAGLLLSALVLTGSTFAAEPLPVQAPSALKRAVEFYHGQVAEHGGYVYRYSDDLAKREGEGKVETDKVWIQPPGTPSVRMTYLEAYELLGAKYLLNAVREAAECLIQGHLRTGGWRESIEFDSAERKKFAYRVEKPREKQNNHTTFDDDKTQSAMQLLMRLDQVFKFKDEKLHEASLFSLDSVVKAQFPNGGWGQGCDEFPNPADFSAKPASYPESWSRTYPGVKYWKFYTLNDNAIADTIDSLLLAGKIYGEPKYRNAALKGGEFLILSQMLEPQPAWAQQYDFDMHPCWECKFEPSSITGGESQGAIRVLTRLFVETGDRKFLAPIPKALNYLERSRLPNGQIARFYELKTNKPLYFTKSYELTYDDSDLPTHYGFKQDGKLDQFRREYDGVTKLTEKNSSLVVNRNRRDPSHRRRLKLKSRSSLTRWTIAGLGSRMASSAITASPIRLGESSTAARSFAASERSAATWRQREVLDRNVWPNAVSRMPTAVIPFLPI